MINLQFSEEISDGRSSDGLDLCSVQWYQNIWFTIWARYTGQLYQLLAGFEEHAQYDVSCLHVSLGKQTKNKGNEIRQHLRTFAPKMFPRSDFFLKLETQKGNDQFC